MSENFITLFNYNYLPQGLSLYYLLKKNSKVLAGAIIEMSPIPSIYTSTHSTSIY